MIWENPPSSTLLGHVPTMTVMLGHLGHVFPFISSATEIDVNQARPSCNTQHTTHNTHPALHHSLQTFYRATQTQREPEGQLHFFSHKGKKKSNCWHGLLRETGCGYFSLDYLFSIDNESCVSRWWRGYGKPCQHSQRNKEYIAVAPTNWTCQHGFYQHLGGNAIIVAPAWRWYLKLISNSPPRLV